jgi:hypothetical protein
MISEYGGPMLASCLLLDEDDDIYPHVGIRATIRSLAKRIRDALALDGSPIDCSFADAFLDSAYSPK